MGNMDRPSSPSDPSSWRMKELRDWLDDRFVFYLKASKKQQLVDMVLNHPDGVLATMTPTSPKRQSRVLPSQMTVDAMVQWLAEHDVQVPGTKQKKPFYIDLVEKTAGISGDGMVTPPRSFKKPRATPRSARASTRKTPIKEFSRSLSPPRRRSVRRKLLDLPMSSSDEEEETSTVGSKRSGSPKLVRARSRSASGIRAKRSTAVNRRSSAVLLFIVAVVVFVSLAWLSQSLVLKLVDNR